MNRNLVTLVLFMSGVILMYSGVKDVNPIELLKNTLQGKPTTPGSGTPSEFDGSKWGENPLKPGDLKGGVNNPPPTKPLNPGFRGLLGNGAV